MADRRRLRATVGRVLPDSLRHLLRGLVGRGPWPAVGWVRFGALRRTSPISRQFGFDRGLPVDRYYVERFLRLHASKIGGRVLEIGDRTYTEGFGGTRVRQSDVLHVSPDAPCATFVGDLEHAPQIPAGTFDCVILTQTLQLIFDVAAALRTIHRILRPGGFLLLTVPSITSTRDPQWRDTWYWSFTERSVERLLSAEFGEQAVEVSAFGNVLSAIAFLHGLAAQELSPAELDALDPDCAILVTAVVRKA